MFNSWLVLVTLMAAQAHATYSVGDSATIKSHFTGTDCQGLYDDTEDSRTVVARNVTASGVDLVIHEVGHFNQNAIDGTSSIPETLFIDWQKLKDPQELQTFCDTHWRTPGVIENVDVPAGHFVACKHIEKFSDAPFTTYVSWMGAVPMGNIKSAMYTTRCTTTDELESYSAN